jgi:prophage tail gpP-like protein
VLVIDNWLSYEVESDMFTFADAFTLRVAPTGEYLGFFRDAGHAVRIYYKNDLIMTGIIEATPNTVGDHGPQIELTGRDLGAYLVDDAAPLLDLSNQTLATIIERLIAAHRSEINGVITDNGANRFGLVGRHPDYSKARALAARNKADKSRRTKEVREAERQAVRDAQREAQRTARRTSRKLYLPYSSETSFKSQTKLGDSISSVIDRLAKHIGVSAWMTADGQLCMARPNYDQAPIGELYVRVDDEGNTTDSNCLMTIAPDVGNRYSDYTCLGQGQAHATSNGVDMASFDAVAQDPSRAFWWDSLSRRRQKIKNLTIKNTSSKKHITRYARTKMEEAAIKAYNATATIEGHEVYPGGPLWAVDTMVGVDFQPKNINAPHYIRRRQFTYDAEAGKATNLTPIPPIWLALDHDKYTDSAYFAKQFITWQQYGL